MVTFLSEKSSTQTPAISALLLRIRAEYVQMPGVKLTAPQARRLWGSDGAACDAALAALVKEKFLTGTREGLFALTATLRSGQEVRVGNPLPSGHGGDGTWRTPHGRPPPGIRRSMTDENAVRRTRVL